MKGKKAPESEPWTAVTVKMPVRMRDDLNRTAGKGKASEWARAKIADALYGDSEEGQLARVREFAESLGLHVEIKRAR